MRVIAYLVCLVALPLTLNGPAHAGEMRHVGPVLVAEAQEGAAADKAAADKATADKDDDNDNDAEPSPEDKMEARFPQPVRVGFLIGLPLLDGGDNTIGYIRDVVRTADGKIQLIVGVGGWFGYFAKRDVAVPLETVAILARQVDVLDRSREQVESAPTWDPSKGTPVDRNETIRIAIARR
jgi:hypothetical protein